MDKLLALDYEAKFCRTYDHTLTHLTYTHRHPPTPTHTHPPTHRHSITPFSRYQFAFPATNKLDNTLTFTFFSLVCTPTTTIIINHHQHPSSSLCTHPHHPQATWLLAAAGREGAKPPRINAADPQAAADVLLAEAKQLGIYTGTLERLRDHVIQGYGNGATALLNVLCDMALERQGFAWQVPQRVAAADRYGEGS